MTDRLTTLALAFGALALFLVLFVHGGSSLDQRRNVARPTTAEFGGTGYAAAPLWLRNSGLRVISWRDRFDMLDERHGLAPVGNLLVVTLPGTQSVASAEAQWLKKWIRSGNTLLVLAALADAPDWATVVGGPNFGDLKVLSGIDFESIAARRAAERQGATIVPNRPHAYFTGVDSVRSAAARAKNDWSASIPTESFMLALGHEGASGKAVLWTRLRAGGRIVVSGVGSIFTDQALPLASNAQLFANIVGANLGAGGAVIFDDFHQGLTRNYDPAKFYKDPRLYATAAILLALWFAWVLGATRLRVPFLRIAAPREVDLVRANAGFLARVLPRDLAVQRLVVLFLARIERRMHAAQRGGAWAYLANSPRIAGSDVAQLRRWYNAAQAGSNAASLMQIQNLIVRMERQIA